MNRRSLQHIAAALIAASAWAASAGATPIPAAGQDLPLETRLAWQIALERACFSPGIIDGRIGPKTELATREFQRASGLAVTGRLDAQTAALLAADGRRALTRYTITAEDAASLGPVPRGWLEKSRLPRLAYPTLEALATEKFHCTSAMLAALNGGKDPAGLKVGDTMIVPAIDPNPPAPAADRLDVDLTAKAVRAYSRGRQVGLLHCSIAADRAKLPRRPATVVVIAENPTYRFDPAMWPEVKGIREKLLIPPGPRNPVGLCWIGLSLPGYGIHGSPAPEMIGKTGSHGCFRLTNWDALRLRKMVQVGTPVTFSR